MKREPTGVIDICTIDNIEVVESDTVCSHGPMVQPTNSVIERGIIIIIAFFSDVRSNLLILQR